MKKHLSHNVLSKAVFAMIGSGLVLCQITGCKVMPSSTPATIVPVRVSLPTEGSKDPTQSLLDWGVIGLDAQGALQGTLVISRDYLPGGAAGKSDRLPKCFAPLTDDLGEIARGDCVDNPALKVLIFPRHVHQECYTKHDDVAYAATEHLSVPGCKTLRIMGYRFDPEIRINVEAAPRP